MRPSPAQGSKKIRPLITSQFTLISLHRSCSDLSLERNAMQSDLTGAVDELDLHEVEQRHAATLQALAKGWPKESSCT